VDFPLASNQDKPLRFDVIHVIERQIVLMWQKELEQHLGMMSATLT
jgi:hypothetical protein